MKKSFLSYGWCDSHLVSQFAERLEASGIPVFLDKWDLSGGQMVWTTIDKAIDEAEKLVLFLSRNALTGKGIREEIDRGLQKAYEKQGDVFIIPVALDDYNDLSPLIPVRVRAANMVRATHQSFDESIADLARAIRGDQNPRQAVPTPTDFYCRYWPFSNGLGIEIGSGIQSLQGFVVETKWQPRNVVCTQFGSCDPKDPSSLIKRPSYVTGANFNLTHGFQSCLIASFVDLSINRNESFFMFFSTLDEKDSLTSICPQFPVSVILKDKFGKILRSPLQRVG
jgi:hypothetical protein